ncbi:hypothetical protein [Roseobacter sp. HKCCA0434]|uniref:hypothetical protein n=1 Tax=Roseobacter sp. HKCCA0434 TaxID=3079297 RepID=UPI002905DFDA|nr:hypothetical protein [Roseobacter sp. HKCCA0434]
MTRKESIGLTALIWLCVAPCVMFVSYLFEWFDIDWPLWARVLVSTGFTVPFIEFIVTPRVERIIAAAQDKTRAELKRQEAREASDGADP